MAIGAKLCLLFLFSVTAAFTVTLALSERNADVIVCELQCEKLPGDEQMSCKQSCQEYHEPEERGRRGDSGSGGGGLRWNLGRNDGEFGKGQQQLNNPYVFEDRHFTTRLESELGSVRFLQKFTDRSVELFRGIEEYRVGYLEAEPQTFVIPNHWDSDALLFVVNGEGTISLINNPKSRQTFNIKRGDIFHIPAGINGYLINRNNNQKLVLAKILRTVSVPGELQTFIGVGGENRESSFLNAFSPEILEAAFDANRGELDRLFFGQQTMQKGIFKKATKEQIRSLEESRIWPFGERKGAYNIFEKKASVQNENGHLHEIDSKDFPDLRNINVAVSFFNITQGSIAGPFYHTKATMVLVVPNGEGQFEMACPHLSEQRSRGSGIGGGSPTYEKVSSRLSRGTVVVVPAGHPVVIEASGSNQNLEVIGFGLNSHENEWFPLAGRENIMSEWEDEAVELTFGAPARAVKKVIEKQNKKMFFKGPERRGRAFA